jgi:hypothetical protein
MNILGLNQHRHITELLDYNPIGINGFDTTVVRANVNGHTNYYYALHWPLYNILAHIRNSLI